MDRFLCGMVQVSVVSSVSLSLSLWPAEVGRVYRLLGMVSHGCLGHGPVHLLLASAAEIGFWWDPFALAWSRPGLPLLSNLAGPVQPFSCCYP